MSKAWDQFLPDVLPHVPGCSDLAAEVAIQKAAAQFLDKSKAWRETVQATTDTSAYVTPTLPSNARAVHLHHCLLDGDRLELASPIDAMGGLWFAHMRTPGIITLGPDLPGAGRTVSALLSLSINQAGASVPDWIFERFHEGIAHGAIHRLCLESGKPYSDGNKSVMHKGLFDEAVADAKAAADRQYASTVKRVVGHYF